MSESEIPEADAIEQAQPVGEANPFEKAAPKLDDDEVPEADAIEQAAEVPASDDHDY